MKNICRYLQKEIASVSRKKLQLVGVACMLIAAKYAKSILLDANAKSIILDANAKSKDCCQSYQIIRKSASLFGKLLNTGLTKGQVLRFCVKV